MKIQEERASHIQGERLVELLETGKIKQDRRPNHGVDFVEGPEELHRYLFNSYMSSCSSFLLDRRIAERGNVYYGS